MSRVHTQLPALVILLAVLTGSVMNMPASLESEGEDSGLGLIRASRSLSDGRGINMTVFDCTGQDDGVARIACDGYLECVNGQGVTHVCEDTEYFDRDSKSCITTPAGASGCNTDQICTDKDDKSYANQEQNCQTYYTCSQNNFFGNQYCPGALVFDEVNQVCNWAFDVIAPCGTKTSP